MDGETIAMNSTIAESLAQKILSRLAAAWNAANGMAFGEPFMDDADFVAIRGDHHHGKMAIAHGHQAIFDSIYQGSHLEYELLQARHLTDDVVLVLAEGNLSAPSGPLAGESRSTATLVLVQQEPDWRIAAFHNTLQAPTE